jgi:hypothetical protein
MFDVYNAMLMYLMFKYYNIISAKLFSQGAIASPDSMCLADSMCLVVRNYYFYYYYWAAQTTHPVRNGTRLVRWQSSLDVRVRRGSDLKGASPAQSFAVSLPHHSPETVVFAPSNPERATCTIDTVPSRLSYLECS